MRDPSESPFGLDPGSLQGMVDDMKNIRRLALIALTAALAVGVSACGESDPAPGDDATSETAPGGSSGPDTWHAAIEAALEEADGSLDDAELEEEGGQHFWQVTVDTADRTEVEVRVDVTSGTATVEQDDDNDDDS